jgi:hypothetical protein
VAQLTAEAGRLGLLARLRFAGHVTDMPAALLAAEVVIHASTQAEAFGRSVIEAQAMARPVIAADLGGPARNGAAWRDRLAGPSRRCRRAGSGAARGAGPAGGRAPADRRGGARWRADHGAMQAATLATYRELL